MGKIVVWILYDEMLCMALKVVLSVCSFVWNSTDFVYRLWGDFSKRIFEELWTVEDSWDKEEFKNAYMNLFIAFSIGYA